MGFVRWAGADLRRGGGRRTGVPWRTCIVVGILALFAVGGTHRPAVLAAAAAGTPLATVTAFYHDLARRDYAAAYALYAPTIQRQTAYANWVAGYGATTRVALVQAAPTPGTPNAVSMFVEATETNGQRQGFLGAWRLASVHGAWLLAQAQIWEVPGAQRVVCLTGPCPAAVWSLVPAATPGSTIPLGVSGAAFGRMPLGVTFAPFTGQTWTLDPVAAHARSGWVTIPLANGQCQGCAGHPHIFSPGVYGFIVEDPAQPTWQAAVRVALVRFATVVTMSASASPTPVVVGQPVTLTAFLNQPLSEGTVTFDGPGTTPDLPRRCSPQRGVCAVRWETVGLASRGFTAQTLPIQATWTGGPGNPVMASASVWLEVNSGIFITSGNAVVEGRATSLTVTGLVPVLDGGVVAVRGQVSSRAWANLGTCRPRNGSCTIPWVPDAAGDWVVRATCTGGACGTGLTSAPATLVVAPSGPAGVPTAGRAWRWFRLSPPHTLSRAMAQSFAAAPAPGPAGSVLVAFGACHACSDVVALLRPEGVQQFIAAPGMSAVVATSAGLFDRYVVNGACGGAACGGLLAWTGHAWRYAGTTGLAHDGPGVLPPLPSSLHLPPNWYTTWRPTSGLAPLGSDVGFCVARSADPARQWAAGSYLLFVAPDGQSSLRPVPVACNAIVSVPGAAAAVLLARPRSAFSATLGSDGDMQVGARATLPLAFTTSSAPGWVVPAAVDADGGLWSLYGGSAGGQGALHGVRLGDWTRSTGAFRYWPAPPVCASVAPRLVPTRLGVWLLQPPGRPVAGPCVGFADLFNPAHGTWLALPAPSASVASPGEAAVSPRGDLWLATPSGALRLSPRGQATLYARGWLSGYVAGGLLMVDAPGNVWTVAHAGTSGNYRWAVGELPAPAR